MNKVKGLICAALSAICFFMSSAFFRNLITVNIGSRVISDIGAYGQVFDQMMLTFALSAAIVFLLAAVYFVFDLSKKIDLKSRDSIIIICAAILILFFVGENIYLMKNSDLTGGYGSEFDYGDHFASVYTADKVSSGNYPPFAKLFYSICRDQFPDDMLNEAKQMQEAGQKHVYNIMKYSPQGMYSIYIYFLLSFIPFNILVYRALDTENKYARMLMTFALCFSGVVLFAVQRGNSIIIVFDLILFFCMYYRDKNPVIRECALLALAAAFGFKLYPAIFGIVFIKEKKWKEGLRAALYGILFTVVPLLFLRGSAEDAAVLGSKIVKFGSDIIGIGDYSLKSQLWIVYSKFSDAEMPFKIIYIVCLLIYIALAIWMFIKTDRKWVEWFVCASACILIPSRSWTYVLIFLIIPLIELLSEKKKILPEYVYMGIVIFFMIYNRACLLLANRYSVILLPLLFAAAALTCRASVKKKENKSRS